MSYMFLFRLFIGIIFFTIRTFKAHCAFQHQIIQRSKVLLTDNEVYYIKFKQELKRLKFNSSLDSVPVDSGPVYTRKKIQMDF